MTHTQNKTKKSVNHFSSAGAECLSDLRCVSIFDQLPVALCVITRDRRICYANACFLALADAGTPDTLYGQFPGEALGCIHAKDAECGTSKSCAFCGIFSGVSEALRQNYTPIECCLRRANDDHLDVRVRVSPLPESTEMYLCVLEDISEEKRRTALEHIFFHDILNTASALTGLASLARDGSVEETKAYLSTLVDAGKQLVDEICAQQDLLSAEKNVLAIHPQKVAVFTLLCDLRDTFMGLGIARGRVIVCDTKSATPEIMTDARVLKRVIGNMLRNALEATPPDMEVRMWCTETAENVCIYVHNPGTFDDAVRYRIFTRSFSTKAKGRGLGTYSMRLLTEKYLKGCVDFRSTEAEGTLFYCELPRRHPDVLSHT